MAKLTFKYGAMNSGKTTILIQTAYNYEERNQNVLIIKPSIDTKGENKIVSRIGASRKVDYLIKKEDKILNIDLTDINCLLIDEAQFMTKEQINELFIISKINDIPVICYGLRTDFLSNGFEGSIRLLEIADDLIELPTICRCGKKARFNGRKINDEFVTDGDSIVIDGTKNVEYESLCGRCFVKKIMKRY